MPNPSTGALSILGIAPEVTPRTYVSPTRWLYLESNGITAKPDMLSKAVMSGTRAAKRINRPTKYKIGGPLALPLGTDHGLGLQKPTFGALTGLTALTADTVKSATPIVTANGVSTITLTNTAAVTYTQYAWIKVGTGATSELRQIATISGNGAANTVLTVGALIANAAGAAGTAVQQIDQLQFTTATTSAVLPTFSAEMSEGGSYAWKLAGNLIDKADYKFDKDAAGVTYTTVGQVPPVQLSSPTSPSPSAGTLADLQQPFTSSHTQFVAVQDPAQAGGSSAAIAQQMATLIETCDISWTNGLLQKPFHDQTRTYRAFPGEQGLTVKYSYANQSGRLAEFDDAVNSLANTTVPFLAGAANDQSGAGTAWRAWGMAIPAMTITDVTPARQVGDVITATVDAVAVPSGATSDLCQVFVVSSVGSTTTGL